MVEPLVEGVVVVDVALDERREAFGSEFFEDEVELFGALVKVRIFGVAEAEDGEVGFLEYRGAVRVESLVESLGVVRWFAVAVGGGDDEEIFGLEEMVGLGVGHVEDSDLVAVRGEGLGCFLSQCLAGPSLGTPENGGGDSGRR